MILLWLDPLNVLCGKKEKGNKIEKAPVSTYIIVSQPPIEIWFLEFPLPREAVVLRSDGIL